MAAPSPREAPVTSATRPASRPDVMMSGGLGEKGELRRRAHALIGQGCRIVAGEAGVAELGMLGIAALPSHGAVEPVDGDEGEAVDADDASHLPDVVPGRDELAALRG